MPEKLALGSDQFGGPGPAVALRRQNRVRGSVFPATPRLQPLTPRLYVSSW